MWDTSIDRRQLVLASAKKITKAAHRERFSLMPVNSEDVLKVTLQMYMQGAGQLENVFHVRWETPDDAGNDAVVNTIGEWMLIITNQLDDVQSTAVTYDLIKVYNVTQDQPVIDFLPGTLAGTVATDILPSGTAALISLGTGFKKTVGKKYFGGLAEVATTAGIFTNAFLDVMDDIAPYLIGTHETTDGTITNVTWDHVKKIAHPIISAVARAIPSYQRRRKAGVGS
jgi:hypothetical protein